MHHDGIAWVHVLGAAICVGKAVALFSYDHACRTGMLLLLLSSYSNASCCQPSVPGPIHLSLYLYLTNCMQHYISSG